MTSVKAGEVPAGEDDGGEKFYRGRIRKLNVGSRSGSVVSDVTGREIPFTFAFVVVVGPPRRFDDLQEGMSIGFDVGWTARGLQVTAIRFPD